VRGVHTAPVAREAHSHPEPARRVSAGRAVVLAGLNCFRADPTDVGSATRGRFGRVNRRG